MDYIQAKLHSGNKERILWIEKLCNIKIGSKIKLKHSDEWWEIIEFYATIPRRSILEKNKMDKSFGPSIK